MNIFDDAIMKMLIPLMEDMAKKVLIDNGSSEGDATAITSLVGNVVREYKAGEAIYVCEYCNGKGIREKEDKACPDCLRKSEKAMRSLV